MYELIVNGVVVANGLKEMDAFRLAEVYRTEHRGEDLTLIVRRQEGKC